MTKAALKLRVKSLYETDFYLWTQSQAELLRERRFDKLDLENLIEEVASVGGSERREIRSRLTILITHLLKWKYQPGARSSGWRGTIDEQRDSLDQVLASSPSLRRYPAEVFDLCFTSACLKAARQTGIDFTLFPTVPPFDVEQTLDDRYLPKEPDLLDQS